MWKKKDLRKLMYANTINPNLSDNEFKDEITRQHQTTQQLGVAGFLDNIVERKAHKGRLHALLMLTKEAKRKISSYIS